MNRGRIVRKTTRPLELGQEVHLNLLSLGRIACETTRPLDSTLL